MVMGRRRNDSGVRDASSVSARGDSALAATASSSVVTQCNAGSDMVKRAVVDWPGQRAHEDGGGGRAARPVGRGVRVRA